MHRCIRGILGVLWKANRTRAAAQDADQLPGRVAAVANLEEDVLRRCTVVGDREGDRAVGQNQRRGMEKLPIDIEGDLKPQPRFRTQVKMLWDDEHFYIAAEMEEPHVWGTLTEHDSVIFRDNDFEVFIDPNGDTLEYIDN